jgi:soluble lytic murein transglycosylase-like protein
MYSHSGRAARNAADEVRRMLRRAARYNPQFSANGNALQVASQQVQDWRVVRDRSASSLSGVNEQFPFYNQAPSSEWIDNIVQQAAVKNAVDPNLVRAIIQVESNFNPHAVSRKGAIGLMQLMPRTARSLNVSNPYDPAQNVDAGVRHFKELLDSYHGNLELSLAAYNAGAGAVHRSRGVPKYPETRNYVKKITGIYGSSTARLFTVGQPLEFKRDADGHLSVSNLE